MIERDFGKVFGAPPNQIAEAPGRVNLIGEHIDYNGGMVLPMALPIGLNVALKPRDDNHVRIASDRFNDLEERCLGDDKSGTWADYAMGAIEFAVQNRILHCGADLYVTSTIPDGAGLSSSAALIVAILKAARDHSKSEISDVDIAGLARQVENDCIGVPCGIMDQMAVAVARPGEAIVLNTSTLDYERVVLPAGYRFAVVHSGQHRKLSDGRYRERSLECDEAKKTAGRSDLCMLSEREIKSLNVSDNIRKRLRHCVTEHARVLATIKALRERDMGAVGAFMNESHISMRDDFEMSTPEIDALVADAVSCGALGARLTGGGFGGCIVSVVAEEDIEEWKSTLLARQPRARFVC